MDTLHHGWVGYDLTETTTGILGVQKIPFGNLPYNSHSFFFSSAYYLGLEGNFGAGATLTRDTGDWTLIAGFFKNDALGSESNARYSFDLVPRGCGEPGGHCQRETNQANLRLTRRFGHGEFSFTELGVSGQYGQIHNTALNRNGHHWAAAAHFEGLYGRWGLRVQAARLEFDPKFSETEGTDTVNLGAFDTDFPTPLESTVFTVSGSYSQPVRWGPVEELIFYNDYSLVTDKPHGLPDTHMNVACISIATDNIFTYFDAVTALNQPFIGGTMAGDDRSTNTRINFNIGYYF